MATQPEPTGNSPLENNSKSYNYSWLSISDFVRRFLAKLIVDIYVEYRKRCQADPEFQKKLSSAFTKLDSATTDAEDDKAISDLQDLVSG